MSRLILLSMMLFSFITAITAQNHLIESPAGHDAPELIKPDVILPEIPKTTPDLPRYPNALKNSFTLNKQSQGEVLDSLIYSTGTELIKEIFTFTAEGNIEQQTIQKQNPQTLAWENSSRNSYTYDDEGRLESKLLEEWSADSSKWINSWLYTNSYDAQGNVIYYLLQYWDDQDMVFKNNNRYFYTYDAQNNLISYGNQRWSSDLQDWVKEWQSSYTFNNDLISSSLYEYWDISTGEYLSANRQTYQYTNSWKKEYILVETWNKTTQSWTNSRQNFYTYDENDHLSLYEYQIWYNDQWENSQRQEFIFTAENLLLSFKMLYWDSNNQEWVYNNAQIYTYDENGYLSELIKQRWGSSQSWINDLRETYTFDSTGYFIGKQSQSWDENLSDWLNKGLYTYTRNTNNQILSLLYQIWDTGNNTWVNSTLNTYEYTPGGHLSYYSISIWGESDWQPYFSPVFFNYDEIIRTTYYCAELTAYYHSVTGISDRENTPRVFSLYQNYPNPFNPATSIEYRLSRGGFVTIRVYNTLGQEVAVLVNQNKTAGKHSVTFDAGHLSSGMYIYKMSVDERIISVKKMMLLR